MRQGSINAVLNLLRRLTLSLYCKCCCQTSCLTASRSDDSDTPLGKMQSKRGIRFPAKLSALFKTKKDLESFIYQNCCVERAYNLLS